MLRTLKDLNLLSLTERTETQELCEDFSAFLWLEVN
jgi:hypothetical protein